jgi:hypothetical protein
MLAKSYIPSLKIRFIKKLKAKIKNWALSDCCKFILVLENDICLSENVNLYSVKLFLAIDHFLPNFARIGQIFSPYFWPNIDI